MAKEIPNSIGVGQNTSPRDDPATSLSSCEIGNSSPKKGFYARTLFNSQSQSQSLATIQSQTSLLHSWAARQKKRRGPLGGEAGAPSEPLEVTSLI